MKYVLLFLMLALTAKADIFRVSLTSSTNNTAGVINSAISPLAPYNRGMLGQLTVYNCPTNLTAIVATNTIYRISADNAVTNTLGTVLVASNGTTADMTISAEIPFANGDSIRIVGNLQDRQFKASCIFITR